LNLVKLPKSEGKDAVRRSRVVGAVHDLLADVEQRLLEIEIGDQEVVHDLVLVGEDEVVEAGLGDVVGDVFHRLLNVGHRVSGRAARVALQLDVVDQALTSGQSLLTAGPEKYFKTLRFFRNIFNLSNGNQIKCQIKKVVKLISFRLLISHGCFRKRFFSISVNHAYSKKFSKFNTFHQLNK
jgi:hypothetical protein